MSFTHLCLSILALTPELSATLIRGLLAAVPVLAGETDKQKREATLIGEMNGLKPRDLEEAMLASQFLTAFHNAEACFSALDGLDPASREASRLRRDGMAMQRNAIAIHRALHRSQARPMLENAEGEPRPTVPVKLPSPRRGKAAVQENPPVSVAAAAADKAGAAVAAAAPAKYDPFKADPSLERLRQNWGKLKRWEDMTMEERRETFGYGATDSGPSHGNTGTTAGSGSTEAARTAA